MGLDFCFIFAGGIGCWRRVFAVAVLTVKEMIMDCIYMYMVYILVGGLLFSASFVNAE